MSKTPHADTIAGSNVAMEADDGPGLPHVNSRVQMLNVVGTRPARFYQTNVFHLGFSFFLLFTAFSGIQNLSTSLIKGNVGTIAPGVLYIVFAISCFFGPSFVYRAGDIRSMTYGFIAICIFAVAYVIAAQDVPDALVWFCLLFASSLVGLMAAPLWIGQGAYMTSQARAWSEAETREGGLIARRRSASRAKSATGIDDVDGANDTIPMMATAQGIFWLCFQCTQISGNVIPSLILCSGQSVTLVFVVYLVFAACGTMSVSCLRDANSAAATSSSAEADAKTPPQPVLESVRQMVRAWRDPQMFTLIPLIMYSGLEQGWIWGDFPAHFIKPSLGNCSVGYIMAVFGGSDALFSYFFGYISDFIGGMRGRLTVLGVGGVAQLTIIAVALKSKYPDCPLEDGGCAGSPDHLHPSLGSGGVTFHSREFYWAKLSCMALVWAIGDAAWNTQLNAIVGETFKDNPEPGFANLKLWQSIMTGIAFTYNNSASEEVKLAVMLGFLLAGGLGISLRGLLATKRH
eukprot:g2472.t1